MVIRRAIGDNITPINAAVVDESLEGLSVADQVAQKISESGIDLSKSGLTSISAEAQVGLEKYSPFLDLKNNSTPREPQTNSLSINESICSSVPLLKKPTSLKKSKTKSAARKCGQRFMSLQPWSVKAKPLGKTLI
jgi:hypothetical protein